MAPGWPCSSVPSSSSSSSHTSTIFSCWWQGTWSKPLSLSRLLLPCHLSAVIAAPLFLTWLIWRSLPNRDLIPAWIIISGFKSRAWPCKWRVAHPERSPSVANFYFFFKGQVKTRSLDHISSRFVPFIPFPSALIAQQSLAPTRQPSGRHPFMHLRKENQPGSQLWGDLSSACFSCLQTKNHIYLSCQAEDQRCNGVSARQFSILTKSINSPEGAGRWRLLARRTGCVFSWPEGWAFVIIPSVTQAVLTTSASISFMFHCWRWAKRASGQVGPPSRCMLLAQRKRWSAVALGAPSHLSLKCHVFVALSARWICFSLWHLNANY